MPLSVAQKIQEIVAAGATVIGPKPQRTPGLTDYPRSEAQLRKVADKVWGSTASDGPIQRGYGKGQVVSGLSIREVFAKASVRQTSPSRARRRMPCWILFIAGPRMPTFISWPTDEGTL